VKDSKLDIRYDESAMRDLRELSARHDVPIKRLRGMAVEKFVENGDAEEYIQKEQENSE